MDAILTSLLLGEKEPVKQRKTLQDTFDAAHSLTMVENEEVIKKIRETQQKMWEDICNREPKSTLEAHLVVLKMLANEEHDRLTEKVLMNVLAQSPGRREVRAERPRTRATVLTP